jgi:hypothetical protein
MKVINTTMSTYRVYSHTKRAGCVNQRTPPMVGSALVILSRRGGRWFTAPLASQKARDLRRIRRRMLSQNGIRFVRELTSQPRRYLDERDDLASAAVLPCWHALKEPRPFEVLVGGSRSPAGYRSFG